ncbi:MAG: ABC transporter substrate-binding protein [Cytophagales bacterium]|nr:ABC transporter substrate-binding protein [Cytophagales bacterium]
MIFLLSFGLTVLLSISCTNEKNSDKKVFRYNQSDGLSSLDPAFARNQANIWATTQIFNGLVELDSNMEVIPSLAERWEISPDGKTYTFYLRKGVCFHDDPSFPKGKGKEMKASDVVYSFKRIISPKTSSTGAWIFNDKVLKTTDSTFSDTCFKALDDYTVRIYLQKTFPPFLQILTMPYAFVVSPEAAERYGKDFRAHPIGTGPFKFKVWEEGVGLVMLKNTSYWKKDYQNRPLPYLDAVQINFIKDKNLAFYEFKRGNLDFLSGIDEGTRDILLNKDGSLSQEYAGKFKLEKAPYLNTEYLGFQLDNTKYSDPTHPMLKKQFRQALNFAINRSELLTYLRNKLGFPGIAGIVPAALPSFDTSKVKGYDYNPEKARKLLAEAGYPNGKGLPEITLQTNATYKEVAEYLQKEWAKLGVFVKIDINSFATHQEMVDNGRSFFFRASWLGDYPDAENYLSLFYSKNFAPSGPNKTHFSSKVYDALYEKSLTETDEELRFQTYQAMENILMAESPVIILYYDEVIRLTQLNILGLKADAMNTLRLERVKKF